MPKPMPAPPPMPRAGATAEEIGQTLSALLEWIVKARLADLLEAGLTHAEVFKLVRMADDYRKGNLGPETLTTIHELADKLDNGQAGSVSNS